MDPIDPTPSIDTYLIVIPIAALLTVGFLGVGWFLLFLLGLAAEVVLKVSQKRHPIAPHEEID